MDQLVDHGLPLVQPREQGRDLIISLRKTRGPISGRHVMQIAALQQVISTCEEVLEDLDAEAEASSTIEHNVVCLRAL
jgi:hypothetical protein